MLWTEYSKKESDISDNDELLELDSGSKTNKRINLSVLFSWMIPKIKKQEFSVNTTSKTLEGAVNELKKTNDNQNTELLNKANGKGITFSINESGGLRVTYDDGK